MRSDPARCLALCNGWPGGAGEARRAAGDADLAELAAAYAFGLGKNHGYVDGNKRVAFAAAGVFLLANGLRLTAPEAEAYAIVVDLAAGELSEEDLVRWLPASVEAVGEE